MKDFYSFDEYSIPLWVKALFWGLYMVVFVYAVWKTLLSAPKKTKVSTIRQRRVEASYLIILYFAAYAVFYCVNPDYFRYRDWLNFPFSMDFHKEQVYAFLIMFCRSLPSEYPYEVFRLIVWGGGVLLVLYTSRMYRNLLMPGLNVLFLFVFYSGTFCYARASLAMTVYFMGISICLWGKNRWKQILGLGLAVCSYFFHHEMIIGIAALPALLLPFEKKKSICFSLILLAISITVLTYINSNLAIMESVFGNDELAEKMEEFSNQEQGVFRMSTFVKYADFFYPFFLITTIFYRYKKLPKPIAGIYRITFALLMATVAFMVVSGLRSTYTYRVMYITIIPMSILITYCYNQGLFKKYQFVIMLLLALLANSVRLINAS